MLNRELLNCWPVIADGRHPHPILCSIPRFWPQSNYAHEGRIQRNYTNKISLALIGSRAKHLISIDCFLMAMSCSPSARKDRASWISP